MKKKNLSPLELEIMTVIWQLGGTPTVRDVLRTAYPDGEKAYTTVQTVMNNLETKGYLRKEKRGLVNFYKPVKRKHEELRRATTGLIEKLFGGSAIELASYLISSGDLNDEEITELKKLIEQKVNAGDANG